MTYLPEIIFFAGWALLIGGIALVSVPAAIMVGGLGLISTGVLLARLRLSYSDQDNGK